MPGCAWTVDSCMSITPTSSGFSRAKAMYARPSSTARRSGGRSAGTAANACDERGHRGVGQRLDDVVLVVEVLVERGGAEVGAPRDLAQREVRGATLQQHLARRRQDVLARLGVAPLAPALAQLVPLRATLRMPLVVLAVTPRSPPPRSPRTSLHYREHRSHLRQCSPCQDTSARLVTATLDASTVSGEVRSGAQRAHSSPAPLKTDSQWLYVVCRSRLTGTMRIANGYTQTEGPASISSTAAGVARWRDGRPGAVPGRPFKRVTRAGSAVRGPAPAPAPPGRRCRAPRRTAASRS